MYRLRFDLITPYLDTLLYGAMVTLQLSALAFGAGMAVAVGLVIATQSNSRPLRSLVFAYVEIIRNTPFLVQLFIVYFVLPQFGLRLSPNVAAFVALAVYSSGYLIEILRAGIESVPRGHVEAGKALGLSSASIFQSIITPQALVAIYPALTGQFVLIIFQSSVVSAISAEELTAMGANISSITFASIETYIVLTLIYFSIGAILSIIFRIFFDKVLARHLLGASR